MGSNPARKDQAIAPGKARVAKTIICQDKACKISTAHLSIELLEVPLQPGHDHQPIAISYTWGEFDRNKVAIGHLKNNFSDIISVWLGKEWVFPDFIARLASLSLFRPIWLDQLCIPQKGEDIAKALASIPTIYRTFDVMVLMPGRPCKCLREFLSSCEAEGLDTKLEIGFDKAKRSSLIYKIAHYSQCLNFTATSSWLLRLWPRQELMYSQRIRCVWATTTMPQCVWQDSVNENAHNLTPYLAEFRKSLLSHGHPREEIGKILRKRSDKVATYGAGEVIGYHQSSTIAFYTFLAGEMLTNPRGRSGEASIYSFMRDFQFLIQGINIANDGTRTATQLQDYVVSIWVDCPGYTVPSNFKTSSLGSMLQNALDQMATNYNWNLLTTGPRGLFDHGEQSTRWKPEDYFPHIQVQNLRDVYGSVFTNSHFFFTHGEGNVAFARVPDAPGPLSAEAVDYDVFFEALVQAYGKEIAEHHMIVLLNTAVLEWASFEDLRRSVMNTLFDLSLEHNRPGWNGLSYDGKADLIVAFIKAKLLSVDTIPAGSQDGHMRRIFDQAADTVNADRWDDWNAKLPLYDLIVMALGLDVEFCWKKGVRIMLSGTEMGTTRLGFYRRGVELSAVNSMAKVGAVMSVKMDTQSSSLSQYDTRTCPGGDLIYEAFQVGEDGVNAPDFEVFGVWVPLQRRGKGDWNGEALQPLHHVGSPETRPAYGYLR